MCTPQHCTIQHVNNREQDMQWPDGMHQATHATDHIPESTAEVMLSTIEASSENAPHQVYVCSKVRVFAVDTMCSSWLSNTVRLASDPAAVTMQALTPNAVATAAA